MGTTQPLVTDKGRIPISGLLGHPHSRSHTQSWRWQGANLHTVFSKKLIGKVTFERNKKKKRGVNLVEEGHSS